MPSVGLVALLLLLLFRAGHASKMPFCRCAERPYATSNMALNDVLSAHSCGFITNAAVAQATQKKGGLLQTDGTVGGCAVGTD